MFYARRSLNAEDLHMRIHDGVIVVYHTSLCGVRLSLFVCFLYTHIGAVRVKRKFGIVLVLAVLNCHPNMKFKAMQAVQF